MIEPFLRRSVILSISVLALLDEIELGVVFFLLHLDAQVLLVLLVHAAALLLPQHRRVVHRLHVHVQLVVVLHVQHLRLLHFRVEPLQGLSRHFFHQSARLHFLMLALVVLPERLVSKARQRFQLRAPHCGDGAVQGTMAG